MKVNLTKKSEKPKKFKFPAIFYGGIVLAALSLIWSGYGITDLMESGPYGLTVAVAGDIGWITIQWAEYRRLRIFGRIWVAPAAGWLIAAFVGALLVQHGNEADNLGQAIAGPFLILVSKTVWAFALADIRDPAELTPEQEKEINNDLRDAKYQAKKSEAERAFDLQEHQDKLARIRMEGELVLAQDEVDYEVMRKRQEKARELTRGQSILPGEVLGSQMHHGLASSEPRRVLSSASPIRSEITVPVEGLTEAQQDNKLMVAKYFLLKRRNPNMSQSDFARLEDNSASHVSRQIKKFEKSITTEDILEAEKLLDGEEATG